MNWDAPFISAGRGTEKRLEHPFELCGIGVVQLKL
jgi:hypothetical protein